MTEIKKKHKLGLALGGGGARGYAHLGALKAMNERELFPDIIAGTSVGALIGVLYADGYSPDQMLAFSRTITFREIIGGTIPRDGLFKASGIQNILKRSLRVRTFEELKLPVKVIATDIERGEVKVFGEGEIIPAVLASCSVPVVFTPVEIAGSYYVDGGLLMNFPVSVIREECEKIIGVDISPVISAKYDKSLRYVVDRVMNCMIGSNTLYEREACDYLIDSAETSRYSLFDFKYMEELYDIGYRAAVRCLDAEKIKPERIL